MLFHNIYVYKYVYVCKCIYVCSGVDWVFSRQGAKLRAKHTIIFLAPPRNFLPLLEFRMILKLEIKYLSSEKGLPPR